MRSSFLWAVLAFASVASAQEPAAPSSAATARDFDDAARERFLKLGEIVKTRGAPGGITLTTRATLRLDGIEHDAHIQTIDEAQSVKQLAAGSEIDFRDSWKNNLAAYRLDRLLGLGMIPATVERNYNAKQASFTWWVDDVKMDERRRLNEDVKTPDIEAWNRQMWVVRIFDQLIYNYDRNLGNLLIDSEWRIWMIDHSRGFKIFGELKAPKNLGERCPRGLLEGLRKLDAATLKPLTSGFLSQAQIDALLKRRDRIVRHFEKQIAATGEAAVLYDLPPRVTGGAALH